MNTTLTDFLQSFAAAAKLPSAEAFDQWAGFSNQLSDAERSEIEQGGAESGAKEGAAFLEMFGTTPR